MCYELKGKFIISFGWTLELSGRAKYKTDEPFFETED